MNKQFTASEVRELAATIWPDLSGREEVAETLHAFADLLEAQERVVPVGEVGLLAGSVGGFTHAVFSAKDVPVGTKLYTQPPASQKPFGYIGWREQKHMDANGRCTVSRKAFDDLEVTTPVYLHPSDASVPDGYVLVPKVPTAAMLDAASIGPKNYKAMLAARKGQ